MSFINSVTVGGLASFVSHELTFTMFNKDLLDTETKFYSAALYSFAGSVICTSIHISLDSLPMIFMSYVVAFVDELA